MLEGSLALYDTDPSFGDLELGKALKDAVETLNRKAGCLSHSAREAAPSETEFWTTHAVNLTQHELASVYQAFGLFSDKGSASTQARSSFPLTLMIDRPVTLQTSRRFPFCELWTSSAITSDRLP